MSTIHIMQNEFENKFEDTKWVIRSHR